MKDITLNVSWKVLSEVDNILTVAIFIDEELRLITAVTKPQRETKNQVFLD